MISSMNVKKKIDSIARILEPITLTIAQLLLSIVSGVTTYYGFQLIVKPAYLAAFAAIGVQTLVFWMPRRLHLHRAPTRAVVNFGIFLLGATISVIFSYQAFIDQLVPKNLREAKSTSSSFSLARDYANEANALISGGATRLEAKVALYGRKAEQELEEGGTVEGSRKGGKGEAYFKWLNYERDSKVDLDLIRSFETKISNELEDLTVLEQSSVPARKKRIALKTIIDAIERIIMNDHVRSMIFEESSIDWSTRPGLLAPEIEIDPSLDNAAAVRDRFMEGLIYAYMVFNSDHARQSLEGVRAGAAIAIFLAILVDLLVLVLGWASTGQSAPYRITEALKILVRSDEAVGEERLLDQLVRHKKSLGAQVEREEDGRSKKLSGPQEIAAQVLLDNRYLRVSGKKSIGKEVLVMDKSLIPDLFDISAQLEDNDTAMAA